MPSLCANPRSGRDLQRGRTWQRSRMEAAVRARGAGGSGGQGGRAGGSGWLSMGGDLEALPAGARP